MGGSKFADRPVLILDLGRVLIGFDPDIIISRLLPYTSWSRDDLYWLFATAEFVDAFEKGKMTEGEFFSTLEKVIGLRGLPRPALEEIWNEMFYPIPEMLAFVRFVKENTNLGLVLLSNISSVHFEYLYGEYEELRLFDEYVLSYKVGYRKPEKGIYRHALEVTEGAIARFYTDDIERFVYSAREMGIDSEVFRGYGKFLEDLRCRSHFADVVNAIGDEGVPSTSKKS